jgi:Uma2 family endonuclease
MATTDLPLSATEWTAVDLAERFGDIPLSRIVFDPPPGTATPEDVTRLDDHHDILCELVDRTLVRKTVGVIESLLAIRLSTLLNAFVLEKKLGIVLGADGMLKFQPGLVRIPDVCYASWSRVKGHDLHRAAFGLFVPELVIELLSKSNTRQEMARKLEEYFEAGVKLVWYIDPRKESIRVYESVESFRDLGKGDTLDAGDIIPGFTLEVGEYFKIEPPK